MPTAELTALAAELEAVLAVLAARDDEVDEHRSRAREDAAALAQLTTQLHAVRADPCSLPPPSLTPASAARVRP
jgi:hypothetical protein